MLLNRSRLEALVTYFGPTETADMIERVIDALAGRMGDLRGMTTAPAASRLGHEIKGMAGMYGLDAVAAVALAIEREATDKTLPEMVTSLDRLMADALRALGAFAAELASPPTQGAREPSR